VRERERERRGEEEIKGDDQSLIDVKIRVCFTKETRKERNRAKDLRLFGFLARPLPILLFHPLSFNFTFYSWQSKPIKLLFNPAVL